MTGFILGQKPIRRMQLNYEVCNDRFSTVISVIFNNMNGEHRQEERLASIATRRAVYALAIPEVTKSHGRIPEAFNINACR